MVIRSSKEYHVLVIILLCCITVLFFLLLYTGDCDGTHKTFSIVFPAVFALVLTILTVRYWISVGRTLILDAEGCTVQFLGIRRTYKWADLKTKRIEDYSHSLGHRQPYTAGAIFYKKRASKPSWLMPAEYSMFVHPFSFFFVYFDPRIQYKKWDYRCPNIYVVEESVFRKTMADWKVELQ